MQTKSCIVYKILYFHQAQHKYAFSKKNGSEKCRWIQPHYLAKFKSTFIQLTQINKMGNIEGSKNVGHVILSQTQLL